MHDTGKILVASQHYPPDSSTTAAYIAAIAEAFAVDNPVVVLSGSANSATKRRDGKPEVVEIRSWTPQKDALIRRSIAISLLALKMFFSTLKRARRNDIVFCVTTPFTAPYAVVLAAKLRGAATALLIYDLYPEALEKTGLIKPSSLTARLIRMANTRLFGALDAIITIGRDVAPLLLAYKEVTSAKINLIPNWTLLPVGYHEPAPSNPLRGGRSSQLVVGLSGNLGFTHSPRTVFAAARLLQNNADVHFLLSGWGIGWKELGDLQAAEKLDNVTLMEPVPQGQLANFLSAADLWVIPYLRNIAGVSIPSRLYNLSRSDVPSSSPPNRMPRQRSSSMKRRSAGSFRPRIRKRSRMRSASPQPTARPPGKWAGARRVRPKNIVRIPRSGAIERSSSVCPATRQTRGHCGKRPL